MKNIKFYLPLVLLLSTNTVVADATLACSDTDNPPYVAISYPTSITGSECGSKATRGQCCQTDTLWNGHPGHWKCVANGGNDGWGCTWWFYTNSSGQATAFLDYTKGRLLNGGI